MSEWDLDDKEIKLSDNDFLANVYDADKTDPPPIEMKITIDQAAEIGPECAAGNAAGSSRTKTRLFVGASMQV